MQHQELIPIDANWPVSQYEIRQLMDIMGYKTGTGICYGDAYANLFSIIKGNVGDFNKRNRFIAKLSGELEYIAKQQLLIHFPHEFRGVDDVNNIDAMKYIIKYLNDELVSDNRKEKILIIQNKLMDRMKELTANLTIEQQDAFSYLTEYFQRILKFHFDAVSGSSLGKQNAANHMALLMPDVFSKDKNDIYFCNVLPGVFNQETLASALAMTSKTLDNLHLKEPVTFMLHSNFGNHPRGHTLLMTYDSNKKSWSFMDTTTHFFITVDGINKDALEKMSGEILKEFSINKKLLDDTERGMYFCPLTLNNKTRNDINKAINTLMSSKEWNKLTNYKNIDQITRLLTTFIDDATPEQIESLFKISPYTELLNSIKVQNSSLIHFMLEERLFEYNIDELVNAMVKCGAKLPESAFPHLVNILMIKSKGMHLSLNENEQNAIKNLASSFIKQGHDINADTYAQGRTIITDLISHLPSDGKHILDLLKIFLEAGAKPNPTYISNGKCSALSDLSDKLCREIKRHHYEINASDQYMIDAINILIEYGANDSDKLISSKNLGLLDEYEIDIPQQENIIIQKEQKVTAQENQIDLSNVISELEQYSIDRINQHDTYIREAWIPSVTNSVTNFFKQQLSKDYITKSDAVILLIPVLKQIQQNNYDGTHKLTASHIIALKDGKLGEILTRNKIDIDKILSMNKDSKIEFNATAGLAKK